MILFFQNSLKCRERFEYPKLPWTRIWRLVIAIRDVTKKIVCVTRLITLVIFRKALAWERETTSSRLIFLLHRNALCKWFRHKPGSVLARRVITSMITTHYEDIMRIISSHSVNGRKTTLSFRLKILVQTLTQRYRCKNFVYNWSFNCIQHCVYS